MLQGCFCSAISNLSEIFSLHTLLLTANSYLSPGRERLDYKLIVHARLLFFDKHNTRTAPYRPSANRIQSGRLKTIPAIRDRAAALLQTIGSSLRHRHPLEIDLAGCQATRRRAPHASRRLNATVHQTADAHEQFRNGSAVRGRPRHPASAQPPPPPVGT